jgi:hypothetical protein
MSQTFTIDITPDGMIHFLYYDELAPLLELGSSTIKRASHVEPETVDGETVWYADMAPCRGPKLGPFKLRVDALAAEVQWLIDHNLPEPVA